MQRIYGVIDFPYCIIVAETKPNRSVGKRAKRFMSIGRTM